LLLQYPTVFAWIIKFYFILLNDKLAKARLAARKRCEASTLKYPMDHRVAFSISET
jgi:hypothetical protein